MKTTIELPDDLFRSAKVKAANQNTTLKSLIEHALRREIYPMPQPKPQAVYEVAENGMPSLKKGSQKLTSAFAYKNLDEYPGQD